MAQSNGRDATAAPQAIRAVIFDFGEVLCEPPDQEILARMAKVFGVTPERFIELYHLSRPPYDRGDVTPEEYWREFTSREGVGADAAVREQLRRWDLEMWSHIRPEMVDWAGALGEAGYRTSILSNMQQDMVDHVRRSFPWVQKFHCQIFSAEVRSVKPEAKIYEKCLECLGVAPREALFIDDREVNLAAARAQGIPGVQVLSVDQLREELRAIGFPVLPGVRAA
ncbi:MAG TPA: HAD family phosphatase [Verrucomicrobiae bacterium]|nr:HAD family phosphatase [Verrucomicrobiae bacterium]